MSSHLFSQLAACQSSTWRCDVTAPLAACSRCSPHRLRSVCQSTVSNIEVVEELAGDSKEKDQQVGVQNMPREAVPAQGAPYLCFIHILFCFVLLFIYDGVQVYGQSYQAKDLRAVVQKYNMDKDKAPPSPPNKRKADDDEEEVRRRRAAAASPGNSVASRPGA